MHTVSAGGEITGHYIFDEFGNDLQNDYKQDDSFGYAGFMEDKVSGTYSAQVREYVPANGRFTSRDFIKGITKAPYTLNEYIYCWNRPLDFVDYSGEYPEWSEIKGGIIEAADNAGRKLGGFFEDVGEDVSNGVTTIFTKANYVWDNYVPGEVQNVVSGIGNVALGGARAVFEYEIAGCSISDYLAYATQTWYGEAFPSCWQKPFGYNDFYDYVFDGFTDMKNNQIFFTMDDGTQYTIWMWKGDYYNLGAGCKTGVNYGKEGDYHLNSLENSNLMMDLTLYDRNTGEMIFTNPTVSL